MQKGRGVSVGFEEASSSSSGSSAIFPTEPERSSILLRAKGATGVGLCSVSVAIIVERG